MNGLSRGLLDTFGYFTGLALVTFGSITASPIAISGGMGLIAAVTGAAVVRGGRRAETASDGDQSG